VSLLDRLVRGHLDDAQLSKLWSLGGDNPHLAGCAECRARYDALDQWLAGIGGELRDEADQAFPADRLAIQHAQIARRLETLERPARVIAFPKAARAVISGHSHVRRWVTVAAAASLIAGFGLGQIVPIRSMLQQTSIATSQPQLTAPQAAARAVELTPPVTPAHNNDDDLLTDGFTRSRVSTLSALDEMTPRARDIEK
jgi:hypothetical protein